MGFLRTLVSAFVVMVLMVVGFSASTPAIVHAQEVGARVDLSRKAQSTTRTLVVVGDADYSPYMFLDNGRPTGFDIELMRALAHVMQTTVQIELLPWAEARARLDRGEVDLIAGMARSPERDARFIFSRPTTLILISLFTRENSPIRSADDPAVRRVGVQRGGIMHDMMMRTHVKPEIVARESTTEILQLLSDGIIDCAFLNEALVAYHRRQMHVDNVKAVNVVQTHDYCIAALKGREALINEINTALDEVHRSGIYDALYEDWLGGGHSPARPEDNQSLLSRNAWPFWLALTAAVFLAMALWATMHRAHKRLVALEACATGRTATEDELQAHAQYARAVMKSLKDGLIILQADGTVERVNSALCDMIGFSEYELLGKAPPYFFVAAESKAVVETMWHQMQQQRFVETEALLQQKDNGKVPVLLSPTIILANDGKGAGWSVGVKDISRRKEFERALHQSEERFRLFAEVIDQALWVVSPQPERVLYISPACERIWGFPAEEFYRSPSLWLDVIHPDDREQLTCVYREFLQGKIANYCEEYRLLRPDGTVRWLVDQGVSAPPLDGENRFVVGLTKDITDQRQAEHELAENRKRMAMMSTSAETLMGGKSPQQIGNELVKLVCQAFGVDACIIRTLEGDSLRFLASFGVWEKKLTPEIPCNWGIAGRVLGPRKALAIPDVGPPSDPLEPGTLISRVNVFTSYAGAPMLAGEEAVGIIGIYSEHVRREFTKQDLSDLQLIANHFAIIVLNERHFKELKSRCDALEQEIAERASLEERIVQGQKLESLGLLAGGVAHDFNNLLVGILGNAAFITEEIDEESPLSAPLSEITQAARLASDVCSQLLDYAGKGRSSSHLVDLNELTHELAQVMTASIAGKATLKVDLPDEPVCVETDPVQMRQAMMNLITNGAESFSGQVGTVKLSVGRTTCDSDALARAYVDAGPGAGEYGYVEVSDDGEGMDSETMARFFDPFFSTKKRGSGLGLSIVLGLVRNHHGVLMVNSRPGEGTAFRILFPVTSEDEVGYPPMAGKERETDAHVTEIEGNAGASEHASAAPSEDKPERLAGNGSVVVVVDDEPSVRNVAVRILSRHGFQPVEASDGEEALALLHEYADNVKCVLLDLTMPKLDGVHTLKAVREKAPHLPVIISSGHAADDVCARCEGLGATAYLQKPYSASTMVGVLSQVLGPGLSR